MTLLFFTIREYNKITEHMPPNKTNILSYYLLASDGKVMVQHYTLCDWLIPLHRAGCMYFLYVLYCSTSKIDSENNTRSMHSNFVQKSTNCLKLAGNIMKSWLYFVAHLNWFYSLIIMTRSWVKVGFKWVEIQLKQTSSVTIEILDSFTRANLGLYIFTKLI